MAKAVIFDMDGLLIDSEPLWRKAEIEIFPKVGIQLTPEDCFKTQGLRIDEVVALWHSRHPWSNISQADLTQQIVDRVIELILEEGQPLQGVEYIIGFFKERNIKIALASSSSYNIIEAVLKTLQIKEHFGTIHSAEEEKWGKPHPAVFITAAEKLAIDPQHCLVFEDSLFGVIAAKAAKMKVIAIPEGTNKTNNKFNVADGIIDSLNNFDEKLLRQLF